MNSKRIVFLLLAVIVAGTTAFVARAWLQSERAAIAAQFGGQRQPVAAKPAVQVLVAKNAIRTGQLVKPDDLRWQPWPQGNLPPSYIIEGKRPISDFVGAVARVLVPCRRADRRERHRHAGLARLPGRGPEARAARRQRAGHGDLDGLGLHLCRRSRRRPADPRADQQRRPAAQRHRDDPAQCARDRDGPEARLHAGRQARRRQDRDARAHRQADRDRDPGGEDGRVVAGAAQPAGSGGRRARCRRRRRCHRRARRQLHPRQPGEPPHQGSEPAAQAARRHEDVGLRAARRQGHQAGTRRQHCQRSHQRHDAVGVEGAKPEGTKPKAPSRPRRRPPTTVPRRAYRNESVIRPGVQIADLAPRRLVAGARRIACLRVPAVAGAGAGPDERPRQGSGQAQAACAGQEGRVPADPDRQRLRRSQPPRVRARRTGRAGDEFVARHGGAAGGHAGAAAGRQQSGRSQAGRNQVRRRVAAADRRRHSAARADRERFADRPRRRPGAAGRRRHAVRSGAAVRPGADAVAVSRAGAGADPAAAGGRAVAAGAGGDAAARRAGRSARASSCRPRRRR